MEHLKFAKSVMIVTDVTTMVAALPVSSKSVSVETELCSHFSVSNVSNRSTIRHFRISVIIVDSSLSLVEMAQ
tara:strand:+ start:150 stop:368 length:219 start_codon:yes stop_codon:yes gene_type:complete